MYIHTVQYSFINNIVNAQLDSEKKQQQNSNDKQNKQYDWGWLLITLMEEQYFLVRRLGLGRGVECRSLVVTCISLRWMRWLETRGWFADIEKRRRSYDMAGRNRETERYRGCNTDQMLSITLWQRGTEAATQTRCSALHCDREVQRLWHRPDAQHYKIQRLRHRPDAQHYAALP